MELEGSMMIPSLLRKILHRVSVRALGSSSSARHRHLRPTDPPTPDNSINKMKNLVHALMLGTAAADITLSRTIDSHAAGNFNVTVEGPACKDKDAFGSNTCDMNWGQSYTVDYSASLTNDIVDGDTITIDATLDGLVPFKATCNLCGQPCTVTVPIVKQTFTINMHAHT